MCRRNQKKTTDNDDVQLWKPMDFTWDVEYYSHRNVRNHNCREYHHEKTTIRCRRVQELGWLLNYWNHRIGRMWRWSLLTYLRHHQGKKQRFDLVDKVWWSYPVCWHVYFEKNHRFIGRKDRNLLPGYWRSRFSERRMNDIIFYFIFHFKRFRFDCTGYFINQWHRLARNKRESFLSTSNLCIDRITGVLFIDDFSARFGFDVDRVGMDSCFIVGTCASVNIDGSSTVLARTIRIEMCIRGSVTD